MNSNTLTVGSALQGGRYRMVKVLGQGGFGITYLAEQTSLGRKVAVKEFFMKEYCNRDGATSYVSVPSEGSRELVERFRAKFVKEAQEIASFTNCPHIVNIIDVFEENGTAYYAMEYLSGGSLNSLVKSGGPLSESEALKYIREVADALSCVHSHNTLHLDVKPANIMLDDGGHAVLIDFGISKHIDSEGNMTSSTPMGVSKGYAPLEQIAQEDLKSLSPATDVYSLGATLYFLLTGVAPRDASMLLKCFPTEELEAAGVSVGTVSAIKKAMAVLREDRPQTIADFLELLDESDSFDGDDAEQTIPIGRNKIGGVQVENKASVSTSTSSSQTASSSSSSVKEKSLSKRWLWAVPVILWLLVRVVILITDKVDTQENMAHSSPQSDEYSQSGHPVQDILEHQEDVFKTSRIDYKSDADGCQIDFAIDYPKSGNYSLTRNIAEWINEVLGGEYKGSLNDGQGLIDFYGRQCANAFSEDAFKDGYENGYENNYKIFLKYDNDSFVSYDLYHYSYLGGAHGGSCRYGVSFRKKDGYRFGWNLFLHKDSLKPFFIKGLKKYFNVLSDDQLEGNLFLENGLNSLPLPERNPWLTPDGVTFSYAEYEIASYSAGEPTFTVPYSDIWDFLTPSAQKLLSNYQ